jgi:plastocyanin
MSIRQLGRLSLVAALVLLLGTLTAAIAAAQGGTSTNITITETEFKLDPAQVTVPLNTPVQFTVKNAGTIEHNLKFELPSANIEQNLFTQNLKPGETRTGSFTFTQAGNWEMYCPVDDHEGAGMKGTVMVMAAQGAGQSASPSTLPVTGVANSPVNWFLAALALAALGLGLRFATRPSHP